MSLFDSVMVDIVAVTTGDVKNDEGSTFVIVALERVRAPRFELGTSRMSCERSNQLSYARVCVPIIAKYSSARKTNRLRIAILPQRKLQTPL